MKSVSSVLAVAFVALFIAGCGDDPVDDQGSRGPVPFHRAKLKNLTPPGSPPSTAHIQGSTSKQPSESHEVGPVPAGAEDTSEKPEAQPADGVKVGVTIGTAQFYGEGDYPGRAIKDVVVEANVPKGKTTVNFYTGDPETFDLNPKP